MELPDDWHQRRQQVLDRDDRQCRNCGSSDDLEVHHIVPRKSGGTHRISNLATLCGDCHNRTHAVMRTYAQTDSSDAYQPADVRARLYDPDEGSEDEVLSPAERKARADVLTRLRWLLFGR